MSISTLRYFGTDKVLTLGDRILVRSLFGRASLATVVFVPGQSIPDKEIGDDQWAYKLDNGNIYVSGFFPAQTPETSKNIQFVSRPGEAAKEVIDAYRIPTQTEEPTKQPIRDFLAVIGCCALIAVMLVVALFAFRFVV